MSRVWAGATSRPMQGRRTMNTLEETFQKVLDELGLGEGTTDATVMANLLSIPDDDEITFNTACGLAGVSPQEMSTLLKKHPPSPFTNGVTRNRPRTTIKKRFDKWWQTARPAKHSPNATWNTVLKRLTGNEKPVLVVVTDQNGRRRVQGLGEALDAKTIDAVNAAVRKGGCNIIFTFMTLRDALTKQQWENSSVRNSWSKFYRSVLVRQLDMLDAADIADERQ